MCVDNEPADADAVQMFHRVGNNRPAGHGQKRFGRVSGQGHESGAQSGAQDES